MNVSDTILGQAPIHAVEERPQQATHHSHHDEKGQVHRCPQVAVLISIWTLTSMEFCSSITLKKITKTTTLITIVTMIMMVVQ